MEMYLKDAQFEIYNGIVYLCLFAINISILWVLITKNLKDVSIRCI